MAEAAPAHACSEGAINPALRVFKVPPTDIRINAYRVVTIQPTTTGINPMEFIIPALTIMWIWGAGTLPWNSDCKRVPKITWWLMKNFGP